MEMVTGPMISMEKIWRAATGSCTLTTIFIRADTELLREQAQELRKEEIMSTDRFFQMEEMEQELRIMFFPTGREMCIKEEVWVSGSNIQTAPGLR
jgi:hypothetical protein